MYSATLTYSSLFTLMLVLGAICINARVFRYALGFYMSCVGNYIRYISLSNFNSNTWLVYGHLITLYNSAVIDATNNTYLLFIYRYMLRTSVMDHDFLYDIIVVCFRNWGFYLLEICYFEVIVVWWQIWVQEHRRGSVYYTDSFIF